MKRFVLLFCRIVAITTVLSGCGTGFVEGWGEDKDDERTPEEKCNERDGYAWNGESCVAIVEIPLVDMSESQCRKRVDATWLDGTCQEIAKLDEEQCGRVSAAGLTWQAEKRECMATARAECLDNGPGFDLVGDQCVEAPSLTLDGELSQSIAAGQAMNPILIDVSEGAFAEIANTTCPGFFAIGNNTLGSATGALPPEGKVACEAELIATLNGLKSKPTKVKVTFTPGFLKLCQAPANQEIARSVEILMKAVDKPSCEEAAKALASAVTVKLIEVDMIDLSPLAGLPKLESLDLSASTRLVDLSPIAGLGSLSTLVISNTAVTDVSMFKNHPKLNILVADRTPLDRTAGGVAKTEANCPTAEGTNRAVKNFCSAPKRP